MRILLALICVAVSAAAPALETARSLVASGAPHLALARIQELQPGDPGAPRWVEWEVLRLGVLVELKRYDEALKRAAALPASLPPPALRQGLLAAMRVALAAGQPERARAYGARLLWQLEATAEEARAARLIVIETHLAERDGDAAFRAMLRFDQDYRPLERAVAERFVEPLLDLGLEKEAVNWLAALEDGGALKLRLRLKTGLAEPDEVIAQARARIAKGGGAAYWQVLADVAEKKSDATLRVETLEQLLRATEDGRQEQAAQVNELWQAYDREARAAANQHRLLNGDDFAWMDLAGRRLGSSPPQSRALFAYLSRNAAMRETRLGAQLQLVFSLFQAGLDHAALSLFGDERVAVETIDPQARSLLGAMAEARKMPALAIRFRQGLAPPRQ